MKAVYLDNSATTRISDLALEKYVDVSRKIYGNPSSLHEMGFLAEKELTAAREAVLKTLSAKNSRVIFTGSGSEANNLAILGRAASKERYKKCAKIITTSGEHASVKEPLMKLRREGFEIIEIPTLHGKIDFEKFEAALDGGVILVTMMMVNNETGALYDTARAAKLMKAHSPDALLHVDATQSYLKFKFTKSSVCADMISISSHKIEGPKGVGALIIDEGVIKSRGIAPIILGGGQEGGLRSGTENVPAIAAFGEAARIGFAALSENEGKMRDLRNYLIEKLKSPTLSEICPTLPENSAPHILNITLPKIKSETMLHYLSSLGIYVSSGSACSSNSSHKSEALIAYGKSESEADYSIRISFSHENTKEDVDALCTGLESGISKLVRGK